MPDIVNETQGQVVGHALPNPQHRIPCSGRSIPQVQLEMTVIGRIEQVVDDKQAAGTHDETMQQDGTQTSRSIMQFAVDHMQATIIAVSIAIYFSASLVFIHLEGWDWKECIYFAVVVVTTVGYGDYLPSSDSSKMFTIFFALFALTIVGFSFDSIAKSVHRRTIKAIKANEEKLGIFNKEEALRQRRKRFVLCFGVYILVLVVGTLVFATSIDWPEGSGDKYINGLYLTVITVTTIGFGDHSPAGTHALKVFGCLLMLIGIPVSVAALGFLTQIIFGAAHEEISLKVLEGRMTSRKFQGLDEFVKDLRAEGLGNYRKQGDGQISRFEYLCFILVENGVVELKNIQKVMSNFEKVNKTHTGFLTHCDVQHSQETV